MPGKTVLSGNWQEKQSTIGEKGGEGYLLISEEMKGRRTGGNDLRLFAPGVGGKNGSLKGGGGKSERD